MANPLPDFAPKKVDPRQELERRLVAAPLQHAEAILVALDVLEEAHQQGLLDALHGLLGSRNAVLAKLAEYGKEPESINAMRNLISLIKILGSIDPEFLSRTAKSMSDHLRHPAAAKPPSLFKLARMAVSENSRNGLYFAIGLLSSIGKSTKK